MTFPAAKCVRPAPSFSGFLAAWGRNALLLLILATFSFQGFVGQVHIHAPVSHNLPTAGNLPASIADIRLDASSPMEDDEAHCLLCQAVALSTGLSTPAAVGMPMVIQVLLGLMALLSAHVLLVRPLGHEWRQRAPPRP